LKAYLVKVNGKRICTAGVGPDGVLVVAISWVGGGRRPSAKGEFHFHVGGLDSRTEEHIRYATPSLKVGDSVLVKLIEAERFDKEADRFAVDRKTGERVKRGSASKKSNERRPRRSAR
jgi:hypothetical protein